MPEQDVSYGEITKLFKGGIRGWLLLKLLDDKTKQLIARGLERAHDLGYNQGYQQSVDNKQKESQVKWYTNHAEDWLCKDCFEWIDQGWSHTCSHISGTALHNRVYEYMNKSPKGDLTTMKKKR